MTRNFHFEKFSINLRKLFQSKEKLNKFKKCVLGWNKKLMRVIWSYLDNTCMQHADETFTTHRDEDQQKMSLCIFEDYFFVFIKKTSYYKKKSIKGWL